jgi:hypothetical protein
MNQDLEVKMVEHTIVIKITREEMMQMICRKENIQQKDLVSFKMSSSGITVVRK